MKSFTKLQDTQKEIHEPIFLYLKVIKCISDTFFLQESPCHPLLNFHSSWRSVRWGNFWVLGALDSQEGPRPYCDNRLHHQHDQLLPHVPQPALQLSLRRDQGD